MNARQRRVSWLRAALLLGFAALIAKLFIAGEMVKYMAPALDPLTAVTGVVMAAMGVLELFGGGSPHVHDDEPEASGMEHALTSILIVVPLALGILVTPRALGAGALGGQSVADLLLAYAPGAAPAPATRGPAPSRPIADTADLLAYLEQAGIAGVGQAVRATGLALHDGSLGDRELALLRYSITHCVADARPIALLVVGPDDRAPSADQWIEVEGVLAVREREGSQLVTIAASRIVAVPEPPNPYLGAQF